MGCEYQYRMTNRAVLDVRETVSYFRNELQNEKAAATWMNDAEKCIGRLCIFPESGTIVYAEYLPQAQVRKKVVRNYILYYQILQEQKMIRILRVIYGRRNQQSVLQDFSN